jgi:hypothetical protein
VHSGKNFLIVGEDEADWEEVSSRVFFVKTFRAARIALLEKNFDYLVLDSVVEGDKDEVFNFIEGLRSHPRLSALEVFVCIGAVENSDSGVIEALGSRSIEVISGFDYFVQDPVLVKDQTSGKSLDSLFVELKEDCAKTLARLKLEISQEPPGASHMTKEVLSKKFFDIFSKETRNEL